MNQTFNSINWQHAPTWANYAVQSQNGKWYWFEFDPEPNVKTGFWERPFYSTLGRNEEVSSTNWVDSKLKREPQ